MSKKEPTPQGHISIRDAASRYKASKDTIKSWAKKGDIPTLQPTGERGTKFVEMATLEKLLKERNVQSIFKDSKTPDSTPTDADIDSPMERAPKLLQPAEPPTEGSSEIEVVPHPVDSTKDKVELTRNPTLNKRSTSKKGRLSDDQIDKIVLKRSLRQLLLLRDKLTEALCRAAS